MGESMVAVLRPACTWSAPERNESSMRATAVPWSLMAERAALLPKGRLYRPRGGSTAAS